MFAKRCAAGLWALVNHSKGRRELLEKIWGFSCDCPRCENDIRPGSSAGDWRVTKMLQTMEALLENAEARRCGHQRTVLRFSWKSERSGETDIYLKKMTCKVLCELLIKT